MLFGTSGPNARDGAHITKSEDVATHIGWVIYPMPSQLELQHQSAANTATRELMVHGPPADVAATVSSRHRPALRARANQACAVRKLGIRGEIGAVRYG
jgi:hypothetical protein